MYSPRVGRFLSADTIVPSPGNPQSLNRYAYTLNNPIAYVDPTGHFTRDAIYNYLLEYFKGDERQATSMIEMWEQDTDLWDMISTAQAGDTLFGYFEDSFHGTSC